MKQRNRIKCIKTRTCGYYIRRDRIRRAWDKARHAWRIMGQAMRGAYEQARGTE